MRLSCFLAFLLLWAVDAFRAGAAVRVCCTTSLKEEYFLEQLALNY